MIRLLVVDDHRMNHRAMAHMAAARADMEVVGEASSGEEALEFVDALAPNVVLMDLDMPGMGGLAATERIARAHPQVRVIVISAQTQEPYPSRAMAAGAVGYLSKDSEEAEIERAIRRVLSGGKYIAADIAGQMAERLLATGKGSPFDALSEREMSVALKITAGHSTQQIADLLDIHPNTVSSFRRRIYDKLNVNNDVELTRAAFRYGVIRESAEGWDSA